MSNNFKTIYEAKYTTTSISHKKNKLLIILNFISIILLNIIIFILKILLTIYNIIFAISKSLFTSFILWFKSNPNSSKVIGFICLMIFLGSSFLINTIEDKVSNVDVEVLAKNNKVVSVEELKDKETNKIKEQKDFALKNDILDNWRNNINYFKKNTPKKEYQDSINKILSFKDKYQGTDCDWRILASVHYREHLNAFDNAWNGQGAFQNLLNNYTSNSKIEDWNFQLKQACNFLKNKIGARTLDNINDLDNIGTALAKYNGCEGKHFNHCAYTVGNINDKTQNMTKCAVDFKCYIRSTDKKMGTMTVITLLLLDEEVKNGVG